MLKVECEACKAPYQVDERRVPPTGLKMRCPKCGHAFTVTNPDMKPAVPGPALSKQTIIGVASPLSAGVQPSPAPSPPAPALFEDDLLPQVPAPKAAPPKPPPPRPPPRPAPPLAPAALAPPALAPPAPAPDNFGELMDLPAMPQAAPPVRAKPPPPAPSPLGDFGELMDLPAMPQAAPPAQAKPPPPAPSPLGDFGELMDLPAMPRAAPPVPGKPAAPPPSPLGDFGELMDLPAMPPAAPFTPAKPVAPVEQTLVSRLDPMHAKPIDVAAPAFDDLPALTADLPAARTAGRQPQPPNDLPAAKAPTVGGALMFEIDLPTAASGSRDLPTAKGGPPAMADLPATRGDIGLPAVFGDIGLPVAAGGGAAGGGFGSIDLPSLGASPGLPVPVHGAALPVAVDQNNYLPRAAPMAAHLPASMNADMHLPAVADALPMALGDQPFLPVSHEAAESPFGEADFGDLDPIAPPPPPAPQAVAGGQGGVGFGELDFGGGEDGSAVVVEDDISPPTPISERPMGDEIALPTQQEAAPPRPREQQSIAPSANRGRIQKVLVAGLAAVTVGGALLQLTSYGAFGWHAISDFTHSSEWATDATASIAKARTAMRGDLYDQSRVAADTLGTHSAALPRAHALAAAAALAEYEFQVRFGRDPARATRANALLTGIATAKRDPGSVMYYNAAAGGRAAAQGETAAARTFLEAASHKDTGDPVQEDIALLRGELELTAQDAAAATKAFTRALQVAPSAHAHYGLARSYALTGDTEKARSEITLTLKATPNHPGALVLKAKLDSDDGQSDLMVIDALKPIVDGPAKTSASPIELSRAYALFGFAQASRGDVGASRIAFEAALKYDSTNAEALRGQGEVFYTEGRFTEALSRFDTAVQADPKNPTAIIADAKAKIALERLADAKAQLAAAQKLLPKNMPVAYWIGRGEEALGNFKGAEDGYLAAIALVTPKDHDAILPYLALSTLLQKAGRVTEAQAKLEEARTKLPDSAAMQRALGEVAAAQGHYDDAIARYQAAAAKEPNDLRSRLQLGETYLRMHRLEEATAEFDKVAAADKDYPNLALRRGELLEQSGHIDQALAQFKAAAEKAPKDLDLQLRLGAALVGIGRGEEGYKVLKPVYDDRQNSAEVNHYLGRAHLLQGGTHLVDALRFLSKAVDIEPTRAEYHLYVAWAATESQNWKLAQQEVDKALALDQLLGDAYWQKAIIEEVQGAVDAAIRDASKALQLRPTRTEAHATLAKSYADKNQTEKALAEWALATGHGSDHPEWEYLYGRLLYERGHVPQALPHLLTAAAAAEAMEPQPGWMATTEFMTAQALKKSGNKVDAKEHYLRFLAKGERSSPDNDEAIAALKAMYPDWRPQ